MDSAKLKEVFTLNEPELVLERYEASQDGTGRAVFRLLDCDGYDLGRMLCEGVHTLAVSTSWESFDQLEVLVSAEGFPSFEGMQDRLPEGYELVLLRVAEDSQEDTVLPLMGDRRFGFIVCRAITYEPLTPPASHTPP
jgi:hypothetical protein